MNDLLRARIRKTFQDGDLIRVSERSGKAKSVTWYAAGGDPVFEHDDVVEALGRDHRCTMRLVTHLKLTDGFILEQRVLPQGASN